MLQGGKSCYGVVDFDYSYVIYCVFTNIINLEYTCEHGMT